MTVVRFDPPLVSLETAKVQLRITDTEHDADVELRRGQATAAVAGILKEKADASWTEATVPDEVQQAILLLVSLFYERGEVTTPQAGGVPAVAEVYEAVYRLLEPYLGPVVV